MCSDFPYSDLKYVFRTFEQLSKVFIGNSVFCWVFRSRNRRMLRYSRGLLLFFLCDGYRVESFRAALRRGFCAVKIQLSVVLNSYECGVRCFGLHPGKSLVCASLRENVSFLW